MVAIAIPLTLIVITENSEISSLKKERIGTAIIPQLQNINVLLAQHRGTANRLLNGNQQVLPVLAELENKIEIAFNQTIKFCDAQRNSLNAPYENLNSIKLKWQTLKKNYQLLTPDESFKRHKDLIAEIMAFQTLIADSASLSLEDELSNYYLMDNMVRTMPYLIENLGQVRGFGSGLAARHYASESEKIELAKLSYSVKLAMQSVHLELEKVFIRLPAVKQELENKLIITQKNIDALLSITEQELINPPAILMSDNLFYNQTSDVITQVMQLYNPIVANLNNELKRRVEELLIKQYCLLAGVIVLFFALAGFIWHIVNRINKPLQHAMICFEKISAEQYDYPITIIHHDEIGSLLQALKLMRNQLVNNIEQLKSALNHLVQAQRIAKLGDWEFYIEDKKFICSEEAYAIFDIYPDNSTLNDKSLLNYNRFLNCILPGDQENVKSIINQALQNNGNYVIDYRILSIKGEEKIVHQCMETVTNKDGKIIRIIGTLQDVTLQREMEYKIKLAAQVFEHIGEGIIVTDEKISTILVNKAFTNITGYTFNEAIGKNPHFLNSSKHDKYFYDCMWQRINNEGLWQGEIWNRRKDNALYLEELTISIIKNESGNVVNYIGIFSDITERKAAEETIKQLAFYDPLTQLPNRRLLQERIKHGIDICRRTGNHLAVLMLDLDKFKPVNDSLGHATGDILLQQVAIRIKNCIREVDLAARLGGDEFVIVIENIEQYENVTRVAKAVIHHLSEPFVLGENQTVHIGASVGISVYPELSNNMDDLLDNADTALYSAKNQGRGCFAYFSEGLRQKSQ